MKLSPKHRALAAVLALGALAVGVDRLVLGGDSTSPSSASASEFLPEGAPARASTTPAPAGGVYSLASARLESAREGLGNDVLPDGFLLPPSLRPTETLEPRASENAGNLGEDVPIVRSVIPGRGAMLAGEFVALGKATSTGLTLVSVDAEGVVVERAGQRQRLELARRSLRSVRMGPSGDSQ